MYWLTKLGVMVSVSWSLENSTPDSIPSPSNQCASRPRSWLETGFPPLRTYWPPVSSSGIVPMCEHGVNALVCCIGAKFPVRYLGYKSDESFNLLWIDHLRVFLSSFPLPSTHRHIYNCCLENRTRLSVLSLSGSRMYSDECFGGTWSTSVP